MDDKTKQVEEVSLNNKTEIYNHDQNLLKSVRTHEERNGTQMVAG